MKTAENAQYTEEFLSTGLRFWSLHDQFVCAANDRMLHLL